MRNKLILTLTWVILCSVLISGCISSANSASLTKSPLNEPTGPLLVFAAGSLADVFPDAGELFKSRNPGEELIFNIAGSQQLAFQIAQGAPADAIASANWTQMQRLIDAGAVDPDEVQSFASNSLIVIHPANNPANIESFTDIADPGLTLVIADEAVPVGKYSLEFLGKVSDSGIFGSNFKTAALSNVVSLESNVRSVLNKVFLGEADAGIVYSSDIYGLNESEIGWIEIAEEFNITASYYIAPVSRSPKPDRAKFFMDFILSDQGQTLLKESGFTGKNDLQ